MNSPGAVADKSRFDGLVRAAKAHALLAGRPVPTTDDVRAVAVPVLRHRVLPNHRAIGEGVTSADLVQRLLDEVRV